MAPESRNAPDDSLGARILDAMEPGVRYARGDLIDKLELSPSEWKQAIGELVERGLVLRSGERRGTRYERASPADSAEGSADGHRPEALSEEARHVLAAMAPAEQYARKDLIDATGVSVAAWNRIIAELMEAGVVLREGERRGTRYVRADARSAPEIPARAPETPAPLVPARAAAAPDPVAPEPPAPAPPEPPPRPPPARATAPEATTGTDARALGRFEVEVETLRQTFEIDPDLRVEAILAVRGLPPTLWPLVSALANSGGGAVVLGARLRNPEVCFIKGVRHPKQLNEALRTQLERVRIIRGIDDHDLSIRHADFAHRRVIALRVGARPERARPVYVGTNAYARSPHEGTFTWEPGGGGVRKCTPAEIDALWDAWARPYHVRRELADGDALADELAELEPDEDIDAVVVASLLREVTGPARRHPELGARRLREVIMRALGVRPLTLDELSELLGCKPSRLEREHLELLVEHRKIVRVNGHFGVHSTQFGEAERSP